MMVSMEWIQKYLIKNKIMFIDIEVLADQWELEQELLNQLQEEILENPGIVIPEEGKEDDLPF